VNFGDFMNSVDVSSYYEYSGSLTQPPCTENITWYVIPSIKNLGMNQVKAFRALWGKGKANVGNNRAIQANNDRKVYSSANRMLVNPMGASALIAGASAAVLAATLAF